MGSESFLDGVDITRQEFYTRLPELKVSPTTAVPSPEKFHAVYDALADDGATEVLSIHISSSLSAIMNVATLAAQQTRSLPVTVMDSHQLSLGTGFLVETAARLAQEGHPVSEIFPVLQGLIRRTHVFAALDTMEFLKRSGRVNAVIAGLGSFLQIKPIMIMYDGVARAERVRTRLHARNRLVQLLQAVGPVQRIAIVHTHAHERVEELRQAAASLLPPGDLLDVDITPVIGAHIGPGAAGFAVVASQEK
jgi:DegV family protein with EDD domain